jgi:hypothetical protein
MALSPRWARREHVRERLFSLRAATSHYVGLRSLFGGGDGDTFDDDVGAFLNAVVADHE